MNTTQKTLRAFHGEQSIKTKYLQRVQAHRLADEIAKGRYWKDGRGCAVGCTLHSSEHGSYETELGIPKVLARLEDGIFEGLPMEEAKLWPEQFLSAITPGADLSLVWPRFAIYLLEQSMQYALPEGKLAIETVMELWKRFILGDKPSTEEWSAAESAAWYAAKAAAESARSAASSAPRSAAKSAAWAAESAAKAAAKSAKSAAESAKAAAESAAWSAALSAESAAKAAALSAAWSAAWSAQAKKLLDLLEEAK